MCTAAGLSFCVVSVPMYATLNIGAQLGSVMSVISFVEMIMIGAIIGSLYRRSDQREPSRATAAGRLV